VKRSPLLVIVLLAVAACSQDPTTTTVATTDPDSVESDTQTTTTTEWVPTAQPCDGDGTWGQCSVEGYDDRPYEFFVPSSYRQQTPIPVVVQLHGGGGQAGGAIPRTCQDGDTDSPACLHNIAEREHFVVVYPNGSGFGLLPNVRTWNGGGGVDGYNCTSGKACRRGVDDIAYLSAVLDNLESWLHVDKSQVYFTGASNGAAMAHRVACEMSDRVAAIAAVAGTNQFAATADCNPTSPLSVMQIHGTDDPCWVYETADAGCSEDGGGLRLGVAESTSAWVQRLGCNPEPEVEQLPDPNDDGATTTRTTWSGCSGGTEVQLMTVNGGGHTWPSGQPGVNVQIVGTVTTDWDSNLIWEFLSRFRHVELGA
jgi:polyhydroxybutyrate depolymerase